MRAIGVSAPATNSRTLTSHRWSGRPCCLPCPGLFSSFSSPLLLLLPFPGSKRLKRSALCVCVLLEGQIDESANRAQHPTTHISSPFPPNPVRPSNPPVENTAAERARSGRRGRGSCPQSGCVHVQACVTMSCHCNPTPTPSTLIPSQPTPTCRRCRGAGHRAAPPPRIERTRPR